jgi:purine-nucleoside phosphorylase
MSTPHLDAAEHAFAESVLLPGDPLRARHLATTLLTGAVAVNTRRNMLGYTGSYRGLRVSVIGSGMGIPSLAIYATELARCYGVRRIVRIGTCAGVGTVAVGDLVLAHGASTDSAFNRQQFGGHALAACADFALTRAVADVAAAQGIGLRIGGVFSTDSFYGGAPGLHDRLARHRILGVEMESAGLFGLALREGIQAVSLLTVSDHLGHGASMPPEQRETGLARAALLALDALHGLEIPG